MNWVLILVVVILAGFAAMGYRKGLLKIVYSLVSWVLILVFVTWATPYTSDFLINHTTIHEKVAAHCEESIRQSFEARIQETAGEAENGLELNTSGADENLSGLGINLPDTALDSIIEKAAGVAGEIVEESGLYAELAGEMADFIVQGLSFFIALIIATLVATIISGLIGAVSKLPVISNINRVCGLAVGACNGLLIVWIVFYLVAVSSTSEMGSVFVSYIYDNRFLTYLYENNLLLAIILKYL